LACRSDADCPVLACGPCEPGTVITKDMLDGSECYRNPCTHTAAYCNADHLCAVHPKTEKDPQVWGLDAGAAAGRDCGCDPQDLLCNMRCAEKKH
jgi:hypothetical protein